MNIRMSDDRTTSFYRRVDVPGGWIYLMPGGPVLVSDPAAWRSPGADNTAVLAAIAQLSQEIRAMSQSISDEINALTAKFQADVNAITAQIGDLHNQIVALQGQIGAAGSTVTQAQVDALAAVEAQAASLATPVVVTPPAAA
jgi:hypothetical protein